MGVLQERVAWGRAALVILLAFAASLPALPAAAADPPDLLSLSIDELIKIEVISVSKRAQPLSEAPAAVTVITSEDIRRSGMTTVPDLLRMVPGLHVANINSSTWAITSRGFNGQFANKLLVMVDGRSVYTPLFSGTYWDVQDLVLEDIERIEVVRGPGGTLWGANAVNGVINIITKEASQTQGLLVSSLAGSLDRTGVAARYGGAYGEDLHYRVDAKYFNRGNFEDLGGFDANDDWHLGQGGLRLDWNATGRDRVTVQGRAYGGAADETSLTLIPAESDLRGGHVLARWNRFLDDTSDLQLQMYYDRTERKSPFAGEDRDTFDLELQHRFQPFSRHDVVTGAGYRLTHDDIRNTPTVSYAPIERTVHLASAFVQDEFSLLPEQLTFTIGSKFEYNTYTGFEYQPGARLFWRPHERHSAWAAVSRAVRSPSRAENDVQLLVPEAAGPQDFNLLLGSDRFDSEDLLAYEVGYRTNPFSFLSLDVAAYYNEYDDVRSLEPGLPLLDFPAPGLVTVPATAGNLVDATGYGVEVATNWTLTDFWRISGGYTFMKLDIDAGSSSDPTATGQEGDTPEHQFYLRSLVDLPWNVELDTALYYVGKVPNQGASRYARLDVRLGWRPRPYWEFSLVGQNLTDGSHQEFGPSFSSLPTSVPRSVYGKVTWQY
jgi:iron complex outermembrane receptor protein